MGIGLLSCCPQIMIILLHERTLVFFLHRMLRQFKMKEIILHAKLSWLL